MQACLQAAVRDHTQRGRFAWAERPPSTLACADIEGARSTAHLRRPSTVPSRCLVTQDIQVRRSLGKRRGIWAQSAHGQLLLQSLKIICAAPHGPIRKPQYNAT